jgi:hypothetical protein
LGPRISVVTKRADWVIAYLDVLIKREVPPYVRMTPTVQPCHSYIGCNTYLFTPWSRVLLEKLTGFQLVKKFPVFYGTRRLITVVTGARHLSLS